MKSGYYITADGERVKLDNDIGIYLLTLEHINLLEITELVMTLPISTISCSSTKLTKLILPKGVKGLYCNYNNLLTELIIPDTVNILECVGTKFKDLILPLGLEFLWCDLKAIDITKYKDSNTIMLLYA